MSAVEQTHARELLGSARAYARRAVEILAADARLARHLSAQIREAVEAEIDRFHLFLVFSALRDKAHRNQSFFTGVHDSLREQFLALEARRLVRLREELAGIPEGERLWKELRPERDPLEPYYGSFEGGCKTLEASPFGVVARRVSSRFFPEEAAPAVYDAVLSITLDTGDRVTREVDDIRAAGDA